MSKEVRGTSSVMEACRLCGTTTSGHENPKFYEMINLAVRASDEDSNRIHSLMQLAQITIESAQGCATQAEHVTDAIKAIESIFNRIKEIARSES